MKKNCNYDISILQEQNLLPLTSSTNSDIKIQQSVTMLINILETYYNVNNSNKVKRHF